MKSSIRDIIREEIVSILNEGKYDNLTSKLTKLSMAAIKRSKALLYRSKWIDINDEQTGLKFKFRLKLSRKYDPGFEKKMYVSGETDGPTLLLNIEINDDDIQNEKYKYNDLNAEIQDALRHELEHVSQFQNKNKKHRKLTVRKLKKIKNMFDYLTMGTEVPAFVYGSYRQAKKRKIPLENVISNEVQKYLDSNEITTQQAEEVKKLWLDYAIKKFNYKKK